MTAPEEITSLKAQLKKAQDSLALTSRRVIEALEALEYDDCTVAQAARKTAKELARLRAENKALREDIRKLILWCECAAGRIKDGQPINWRDVNSARAHLAQHDSPGATNKENT